MIDKAYSKKGASLVFALGVLLASSLISIAIITAALTIAKTAARQEKSYQSNMAISSAASYVRKLFDGCSYSYDEAASGYIVGYGYDQPGDSQSELGKLVEKEGLNSTFESEFDNFAKEVCIYGNKKTLNWRIYSEGLEGKDPLEVKIFIENVDKDIKVTLWVDDNKDNINDEQETAVMLYYPVYAAVNDIGEMDYTWSDCSVEIRGY